MTEQAESGLAPRLSCPDPDCRTLEVQAQLEAENHQPEQGGGCTCGFCAWSVAHVVIMSVREAVHRVGI